MLPEFAQPGAFPAATDFGAWGWLADEVGEMAADKGGDRLPMAFETEAAGQLIGYELKVGRFLQRDKIFKELAGGRWPIRPMAATGEVGVELRAVAQPARAESVKECLAELEEVGGFGAVDLPVVKLLEEVLEKGAGQTFGQLFFFMVQNGVGVSLGRGASSASAPLRPPQPRDPGIVPIAKILFSF